MNDGKDLAHVFDRYIFECQFAGRLSPETIRAYKATFALFKVILPEVSEVEQLTPEMLVEFFRRLQSRSRAVGMHEIRTGVKTSTVKSYWSNLSTFFKWLEQKSVLSRNPLSGLRQPMTTYADKRELDETVVHRIYSTIALQSKNSLLLRRDTLIVSLLLFCGLRRGELVALEAHDIDIEKMLIMVKRDTSKSRKVRYIPIHPTLLLHLKDYIAERNKWHYHTHYLLVSSTVDRGLTPHGLKHWVDNMKKKTGVDFHLHQFRHAFACNLARKDVNAFKIQKLLGHSSLDMTMTYLRSIGTEELMADISKLSI